MKQLALTIMVSGLLVGLGLQSSRATTTTGLTERVQQLASAFHKKYRFPGATISFVLPNEDGGNTAVGLADVEAGLNMTPANRMLAASIGKTMVGALVLSLESDGILNRSDHASRYLGGNPWFSRLANAPHITIKHLLTHSSGLPDHVHSKNFAQKMVDLSKSKNLRPQDAIAFILDKPPLFRAGSGWSYSDTGYLLLGLIIERATGRKYYKLIADRFLRPLDLSQTDPSTKRKLPGLAVGYTSGDNPFGLPRRTSDKDSILLWNPAIEWTGGGLVSTSRDLARWGHALFTGKALARPYVDRLLESVSTDRKVAGVNYGSGVGIYSKTNLGPVYGHGAWVPGYISSLRHYAKHKVTVAFQINTDVDVTGGNHSYVAKLEKALASLVVEAIKDN